MNKIKQLIAPNFQGRDLDLKFGDINLIVADNATGKTSVSNAIRVLLYGHVPRLGKTEAATFQLCSDEKQMSVEGVFSNGELGHCIIDRSETGACSRNFQPAFETPMVLLDPQEYFKKTGPERMRYVFDRVDLEKAGYDEKELRDSIAKVELVPAAVAKPIITRWCETVTASIVRRRQTKQTVQEWIVILTEQMKKSAKACSDTARQQNAALTALRHDGPVPENVSPAYTKACADLEALVGQIGAAKRDLESATPRPEKLAELRKFLADSAKRKADIAVLKGEILKLNKAIKAFDYKKRVEVECRYGEIAALCAATSQKIAAIALEVDALEDCRKKMRGAKCCPLCQADGMDWFKTWSESNEASLSEKNGLIVKFKKLLIDYTTKLNAAKDGLDKAVDDASQQATRQGSLLSKKDNLIRLEHDQNAEPGARKELERLEALDPKLAKVKVAKLTADYDKLGDQVRVLSEKEDAWRIYQSNKERRAEAETASVAAICEAGVINQMRDLVLAAQEKVVNGAFNSLLAKARLFTDGLIRSPLEYREGDLGRHIVQADIDAGLKKARVGQWLPHDLFSGWERTLAYIGLSIALCQQSPVRLAIIDDLIISRRNKGLILERMRLLIKQGDLDQVFILDAEPDGWLDGKKTIPGVNIITIA
jgi:hypothetical protein